MSKSDFNQKVFKIVKETATQRFETLYETPLINIIHLNRLVSLEPCEEGGFLLIIGEHLPPTYIKSTEKIKFWIY